MFTKEQVEEMHRSLSLLGRADSSFDYSDLPLTGLEEIAFVQGGRNVRMRMIDLLNQLLIYRATDFINISDKFSDQEFTLSQAIVKVDPVNRRSGVCVTYIDSTSHEWVIYQFKGSGASVWLNTGLWGSILGSITTNDLSGKIPYTGANSDVNLGTHNMTLNALTAQSINVTNLSATNITAGLDGKVPYSGATSDVNLGVHGLIASSLSIPSGDSTKYLMGNGVATTQQLVSWGVYTENPDAQNLPVNKKGAFWLAEGTITNSPNGPDPNHAYGIVFGFDEGSYSVIFKGSNAAIEDYWLGTYQGLTGGGPGWMGYHRLYTSGNINKSDVDWTCANLFAQGTVYGAGVNTKQIQILDNTNATRFFIELDGSGKLCIFNPSMDKLFELDSLGNLYVKGSISSTGTTTHA